jgi:ribosomal protein S1
MVFNTNQNRQLYVAKAYNATVDEIRDYGLMVKVESYKCLLHISEIRKRGRKMSDFKVGDKIDVIVTSFDKNKKRYSLIAK